MLDMQAWYIKNKYVSVQSSPQRLLDLAHVEAAGQELGPFVVENTASSLPGCR
jgi:hypothetical protein